MSSDLVSVVIPFYNSKDTLGRAIASLVNQTHQNWECLLIDDGSTDGASELISMIGDPRLRYYRFDKNQGRGAARQKALQLLKGEYVCMLDADDWYLPEKLSVQLEYLKANPHVAYVSACMYLANQTEFFSRAVKPSNAVIRVPRLSRPRPLQTPFAPSMIRAAIAKKYAFDLNLKLSQDFDYLVQIALAHEAALIETPFYVYTELTSTDTAKILKRLVYQRRSLKKFVKDYPWSVRYEIAKLGLKSLVYPLLLALKNLASVRGYTLAPPQEQKMLQSEVATLDRIEAKWRSVSQTG